MTGLEVGLSRSRSRNLTIFATLLSMIAPFSINTYLPSFPDIEAEFGISRAILTQSLAVYLLAFAISTLVWGPVADRFGRRLVILSSMAVYTLASIGCALADSADMLLFLRVVQGLTASGGVVAARAMIRDANSAEDARRAMSQVVLYFALAPAIAPLLGGWLHDQFGWRSVFWFLSGFGAVLGVMGLVVSETLGRTHRRSIHPSAVIRTYMDSLLHKSFPALIFSWALAFAGLFLFIAGAPTIIYDFLHLGSKDFAWLFLPIVIGTMLGGAISSRLAHRWPAHKTISVGMGSMMLAAVINIAVASFNDPGIIGIITPLLFYVTGFAFMIPALTILALDCLPNHRGTAASMQGFVQVMAGAGVASFVVPLLSARLLDFVLGQAVFILLAVALWYRLNKSGFN
jgi:DHA1 family bicyclomycin/chloramphenicol resistance-like MFS transporter